jgi:hypothetical protein
MGVTAEPVSCDTTAYLLEWLLCVADALSEREQRMISVVEVVLCGFSGKQDLGGRDANSAIAALNEALASFPLQVVLRVRGCGELAKALQQLLPRACVLDEPQADLAELAAERTRGLAPPTTVPARIGHLGSELDFFADVSENERKMVVVVALLLSALEESILSTHTQPSFGGDPLAMDTSVMKNKSDLPSLKDFIADARHQHRVQVDKMIEALETSYETDSEARWAVECSMLLAQILCKTRSLKSLPREFVGAIQIQRIARREQTTSPLCVGARLLRTVWYRCHKSRCFAMNAHIKLTRPHLLAAEAPHRTSLAWPATGTRPSRRFSFADRGSRALLMSAKAAKVAPAMQRGGTASALRPGGDVHDVHDVHRLGTEAQERFTRLAADTGMVPLLTFWHERPALTSGLLFDETAVRKSAQAELLEYWSKNDRVEVALEWLFEYYQVMLDALSLKYGRVCYVQPIVRMDGSSPQLQALVLDKLATINSEHHPPVLRPAPLIVLDNTKAAAALKRSHEYYANHAKTMRVAGADGASVLAEAGLDPTMLARSLGGSKSDASVQIALERGVPALDQLLDGTVVVPAIISDDELDDELDDQSDDQLDTQETYSLRRPRFRLRRVRTNGSKAN